MNWIMLRPNSDTLRGIFGLPGRNQNESLDTNDCCNMLSYCCWEVYSAIYRRFPAATGTEVCLWTRSGILKKTSFSKIIITPLPRVCNLNDFSRAFRLGGGSPIENLTPIFFFFQKKNSSKTSWWLVINRKKVLSNQKVLLWNFLETRRGRPRW